uniref:Uncharacterized protein n=1 Tax=Arundo donax TaxID=35708 RepID=A0A0A8YQ60_ARUDO
MPPTTPTGCRRRPCLCPWPSRPSCRSRRSF